MENLNNWTRAGIERLDNLDAISPQTRTHLFQVMHIKYHFDLTRMMHRHSVNTIFYKIILSMWRDELIFVAINHIAYHDARYLS